MTLSHRQYEELRTYPTAPNQSVVYRAGGHSAPLIKRGYLVTDGRGGIVVSDAGREAMRAYEVRYGIRT